MPGTPTIYHWGEGTKLIVGSFCSLGAPLKVFLGGNHRTDWVTTYPFGTIHKHVFNTVDGSGHPTTNGDVRIGNDVWIGSGTTIMSGVTIGDGAVVAANSHVVKNVEPYSIVGGNPARHIRYRHTREQIEALLKIQWWNWEDAKINEYAPLLCSGDIDAFIRKASSSQSCTTASCTEPIAAETGRETAGRQCPE